MTSAGSHQPPQQSFLRRNRTAVTIGSLGVLASSFIAVAANVMDDDEDYDAYCVDQNTGNRVDDDDCDDDARSTGRATGGHYFWYHVPSGTRRPAVGAKASGGSYTVPSRGGFGSSAKSGSGGSGSTGGKSSGS
jgi:hypothetical protein